MPAPRCSSCAREKSSSRRTSTGREVFLAAARARRLLRRDGAARTQPRHATCVALVRTRLVAIKSGELLMKLRRDPTLALEMLQPMSRRIRYLEEQLAELMQSELASRQQVEKMLAKSEYHRDEHGRDHQRPRRAADRDVGHAHRQYFCNARPGLVRLLDRAAPRLQRLHQRRRHRRAHIVAGQDDDGGVGAAARAAPDRGEITIYYTIGNHDIILEHYLGDWGGIRLVPFLNVQIGQQAHPHRARPPL